MPADNHQLAHDEPAWSWVSIIAVAIVKARKFVQAFDLPRCADSSEIEDETKRAERLVEDAVGQLEYVSLDQVLGIQTRNNQEVAALEQDEGEISYDEVVDDEAGTGGGYLLEELLAIGEYSQEPSEARKGLHAGLGRRGDEDGGRDASTEQQRQALDIAGSRRLFVD